MAVYRVQRTRDYTVMSNYHLKDKGLTLKSKGLLSMILSLPEEWNYTTTDNDLCDYWDQHENENEWTYKTDPPAIATNLNSSIRTQAVSYGLHVSDVDLETDLANSPLKGALRTHYNKRTVNTLVKAMQTKKAENMMHFLSQNHDALSCLVDDNIVLPLSNLKIKVEERIHPTND